jgi:hypothetical protein
MDTFTATLYWPDPTDERYQDESRIVAVLGPAGEPPHELRVGVDVDGTRQLDTYKLDRPYRLPDAVFYRYSVSQPGRI